MMGRWSRIAGEIFLDWLAPKPAMLWRDVGCGNGAFTELLFERVSPLIVKALDPSSGLLATARQRLNGKPAEFFEGDGQVLPFEDNEFDASVMALVINFLPEPPKAVAEMTRVVKPGGSVSTYIWDIEGGGFTMEPIRRALNEFDIPAPVPGAEKARLDYLKNVWVSAGLEDVETNRIDITLPYETLPYEDFDEFWNANTNIPNSVANAVGRLAPKDIELLGRKLQSALPKDSNGRIAYGAFANAVKGRLPM
jgi:ubiquinone/menaquinone biosynthesis C-methylase UbiE